MLETLGKYVGGKVITAVLVLGTAATGYWFYQHPDQLESLWNVVKRGLVWLGLAMLIPWAAYPLVTWVVRKESNQLAGVLLLVLTTVDGLIALALCGWDVGSGIGWAILVLGFLSAGIYNYRVCDFLAERLETSY